MMRAVEQRPWEKALPGLLAGLADGDVPDVSVSGLAVDSRAVRDGGLFLAACGLQRHGLEFAEQAWAAGAAAIAWEPDDGIEAPRSDARRLYLRVPGLKRRCGEIASRFFDAPSHDLAVAGVTGTNGKTTVTHLVSRASRFLGLACGQMGTIGFGLEGPLTPSALTTPDVVTVHKRLAWLREQGARRVAMEVSSHALDQGRVDAVRFDTAVFTNLSRDHLDYHASLEEYGAVKCRLFATQGLRHAVVNVDDPFSGAVLDAIDPATRVTAVCHESAVPARADAHIVASAVTTLPDGLHVAFDGSYGRGSLHSPLRGGFNAANLLEALAVLLGWDAPLADAVAALSSVRPPAGRMETYRNDSLPLLVIDYAHTPDALANALAALRQHCEGELWCVFGCGGDRDRGKRPEMARAAAAADRIVVTDDNPRHEDPDRIVADIVAGFAEGAAFRVVRDRREAIRQAATTAGRSDVVLVAGKGHEGFQIVGSQRLALSDRAIVAELSGAAQ